MLKNKKHKFLTGFTLIEFIMVIVLLGIISSVLAPLMVEVASGWQVASRRNNMTESARVALDRIIREIRLINSKSSITIASSTTFQFVDVSSNTITFSFSGGHLIRTQGASSNELADNITGLSFSYYDASDIPISIPTLTPQTNIRRIIVDLTFSLGGTQLNIQSGVSPRRLQ